MRRIAVLLTVLLGLSACGGRKAKVGLPNASTPTSAAAASPETPVPTPTPSTPNPAPANVPLTVNVPKSELEGLASYYAEPYHGRRTANGEVFDSYRDLTAAHRTLPFNTMVRVTNKSNGESVDVRINDRGPFIDGRVIDLSKLAAQKIDMVIAGVVPVALTILKQGDGARALPPPPTSGPYASSGSSPVPVYAVQVGAFGSMESAVELKLRLERKYSAVSIQSAPSEGIYRVRVGNEPDLRSAEKLASQLRKEELTSFVVRVN